MTSIWNGFLRDRYLLEETWKRVVQSARGFAKKTLKEKPVATLGMAVWLGFMIGRKTPPSISRLFMTTVGNSLFQRLCEHVFVTATQMPLPWEDEPPST
jgi:hypothetical protein